jgi:hypothetical protein
MSETDQDYKVLNTPNSKQQVKVRNYTTGTDEEAIMDLLMGANTTTVESTGEKGADGKELQIRKSVIDATIQTKYNRLLLDRFVVEVDGDAKDAVQRVFDMRRPDYKHVLDFITKLTADIGGLNEQEKKG